MSKNTVFDSKITVQTFDLQYFTRFLFVKKHQINLKNRLIIPIQKRKKYTFNNFYIQILLNQQKTQNQAILCTKKNSISKASFYLCKFKKYGNENRN